MAHEIIIRNGLIVDGTGRDGYTADIAIDGVPRYTLYVIDSSEKSILGKKSLGVFVVPLGMERELQVKEESG